MLKVPGEHGGNVGRGVAMDELGKRGKVRGACGGVEGAELGMSAEVGAGEVGDGAAARE